MLPSAAKDLFVRKVLALCAYTVDADGTIRNRRGRVVKQSLMEDGYCRVGLSLNGKAVYVKAHRVVAIALVENPDPLGRLFVNHKDTRKSHNHPDNLEWVTTLENVTHAIANDLLNPAKGEELPHAKLTQAEIDEIRRLRATTDMTQAAIGALFGVKQNTVSVIEHGVNWKIDSSSYGVDLRSECACL